MKFNLEFASKYVGERPIAVDTCENQFYFMKSILYVKERKVIYYDVD